MTLDATLDQRRPHSTRALLPRADHAVRPPVRALIEDPASRALPGGATQLLMPVAGIMASIGRRAW